MNSFLEKIYFKSPIIFQNIMVSVYGLKLKKERYSDKSEEYEALLSTTANYSQAQMKEYVNKQLLDVIKIAYTSVPFYQQQAKVEGLDYRSVKSVEDLGNLPLTNKEELRKSPISFRIHTADNINFAKLNTSGTSGTPLTIYCDDDSRTKHYAFFTRLRSWFSVSRLGRRATFFGRIICDADAQKPPYWRSDFFQNNLLFSSYHLKEENLKHYYQKLKQYKPEEIFAYPSSIYQIAKYINKNKLEPIKLKLVMTTAETLLAHQREAIEKAFNAPLVDQYGCTEMALFVSECEHGTKHIHPEHGIVEVLDDNDNPAPNGVVGRAVCTGFVNKSMPLIRYDMGDLLSINTNAECQCGRAFPIIGEVQGRVDDELVTPDGRPLGRMDPIFKGFKGIQETQIVQTAKNILVFKMVVDEQFTRDVEQQLLKEIKKRTGNEMEVQVERLSSIDKDKNGKFRAVISELASQ